MDKNIELVVKNQEGNDRLLPVTDCENILNLPAKIAHDASPASKKINLTLPASGGSIIAPGDGYINFTKTATGVNQYIVLFNQNNGLYITSTVPASGNVPRGFIPVSKGDTVVVQYTAGGTPTFLFIPLNGNNLQD